MNYASASDDPAGITPASPAEFAAGVSGTQVTVSLADLQIVHDYARHFDVDDDPSMERIRKAIDDAERALIPDKPFDGMLAVLNGPPRAQNCRCTLVPVDADMSATGTPDGPAKER
jgi:hypothetical protein